MAFELSGLRMVLYGILETPLGHYPDVSEGEPSLMYVLGLFRKAHEALQVCESMHQVMVESKERNMQEMRDFVWDGKGNFEEWYEKYHSYNYNFEYKVVGVEVH